MAAAALLAPVLRTAITRSLMVAFRRGLVAGFRAASKQSVRRRAVRSTRVTRRRRGKSDVYFGGEDSGSSLEITSEMITRAMQSPAVRQALKVTADRIAGQANGIISGEGLQTITAVVESGTRPRGRPYSRVVIEGGARFEWGTQKVGRRRILGRAGAGMGSTVRVGEEDM